MLTTGNTQEDQDSAIGKFKRYEEIKIEIKTLEAEADELKPELISLIPEDNAVETDRGSFTLKRRTKWVYSPETTQAEKNLKETKKTEEQTGIAKATEGEPFVEYREKTESKSE